MGPCRAVEPEKGARRSRSRSSVWRDQDRLRCCFRRCERTGKRRVGRPRLATRRRADRTTTRFASRFRRRLSSSSHGTSRSRPATVPELASERTDRGRGLDRALLFCNANLAPVAHPAPDLCLSSRLLSSPSPNPHPAPSSYTLHAHLRLLPQQAEIGTPPPAPSALRSSALDDSRRPHVTPALDHRPIRPSSLARTSPSNRERPNYFIRSCIREDEKCPADGSRPQAVAAAAAVEREEGGRAPRAAFSEKRRREPRSIAGSSKHQRRRRRAKRQRETSDKRRPAEGAGAGWGWGCRRLTDRNEGKRRDGTGRRRRSRDGKRWGAVVRREGEGERRAAGEREGGRDGGEERGKG
ncbi:hypothetical protein MARPO_0113s0028 [Marchantia polymorpha]|uniref:Uncharacterized protein n=1 Tax=Marchantia polymorpha TaxID=3197 RepID=A0A2R6WBR8_MARPO|nr:hypothetical protein MARPO_0113s0028 [Marchantia polymorpha]|eukprot:PTQ31291.1 hypothetical protein MARPO_0113s0028 [Marchantia polymorpha]